MTDHTDCTRQFRQLSRAWYGSANLQLNSEVVDEITAGFYDEEGGTTGEFTIKWIVLAGQKTPQLCVFDDAWDALWQFRDVLEKLAELDGTNPTPEKVCSIFVSCGVEDTTPEQSPYTK